jgi:hypothetical protein
MSQIQLWDICLELQSLIQLLIAHNIYALNDNVPNTAVSGNTMDISHLREFAWYDWVWYLDPVDFLEDKRKLGRWIGPAHDVGNVMCARILVKTGQIVSQTSYSPLFTADLNHRVVQLKKSLFDGSLNHYKDEKAISPVFPEGSNVFSTCSDNWKDEKAISPVFPEGSNVFSTCSDNWIGDKPTMPQADKLDHEAFDQYINAKVALPY